MYHHQTVANTINMIKVSSSPHNLTVAHRREELVHLEKYSEKLKTWTKYSEKLKNLEKYFEKLKTLRKNILKAKNLEKYSEKLTTWKIF